MVDGRIRGRACQAFRTRILLYMAPTRCPSHVHVCPHTLSQVCALGIYVRKKNPEKLPHLSDFLHSGLWLSSIAPLVHLSGHKKNAAKRHVRLNWPHSEG